MSKAAHDEASELPRWKRRLFSLLLLIAVLGTLEFSARLYLRFARGYDGHHLYQFAYDPYKNILPAPNYVDTRGVRHNAQGFRRSSSTPRLKPPRTLRVFLMGASAAYGLGGQWPHIQNSYPVLKNTETIDANGLIFWVRAGASSAPTRPPAPSMAAMTPIWPAGMPLR